MPYPFDFASNVSVNYNTLKLIAESYDILLKGKNADAYCRVSVQVDDELAIKSLNISFDMYCQGKGTGVSRTFTSGTNMTNSNINTNIGSFITTNLVTALTSLNQFINTVING